MIKWDIRTVEFTEISAHYRFLLSDPARIIEEYNILGDLWRFLLHSKPSNRTFYFRVDCYIGTYLIQKWFDRHFFPVFFV